MNNYVLAIDDIYDNLLLIQLALEQEGYSVVLADSGQKALKIIDQHPPDLILVDVMMPEMDGYEVTRRVRQHPHLPYIPILLITAHEKPSLIEGLDLGADEFIRKPIKLDELKARVRSLLRLKETMDQRDNFVSCLTHDLRTPLVAMDRMLQLLKQGTFGVVSPEMKEAFKAMMNNNKNLLQMLNNLLDVHCYDLGHKNLSFIAFDLQELLTEIIQELLCLAEEKGLNLELNCCENLPEIKGDRLELRRVFMNLISNAIKFTDTGEVIVRCFVKDDYVRLLIVEVQDTGIGMSPETQLEIFQRFRQGNHKRSGQGLGLYLCQKIIEAHEATINVTSKLNQGSLFRVSFPL
ncbi:hybrid sensor histidine kinase/response regulator [Gloeocapsa sp. PCC 73106]|uniref:ATP-binding response regulator n=1 Tax=Gloeocapsa sp. PCC 73106 TaxID=102232 RepID=UPI0002AC696D|nr:hybrid sensor histidine kinase/response regulator [Gloeocapsa sp. PCC 73106]ELR98114.1 signal transduction histidine kinase [Gloeocapsa sp. PCC 73106]